MKGEFNHERKEKIVSIALAAALAATAIVGSSLAYFTDKDEATNTFTVGKVDIELTEPNWDANINRDLIPGKTIPKDPTITVAEDSETAYTFMKVEVSEDFADLMKAYATETGKTTPEEVIAAWFTTEASPKVMEMNLEERYVILGVLSPKAAGQSVTYFDEVKVPAEVTQEMIKANGTYTIKVTAYAIQAEGFYDETDEQASHEAAFKALFPDETIVK